MWGEGEGWTGRWYLPRTRWLYKTTCPSWLVEEMTDSGLPVTAKATCLMLDSSLLLWKAVDMEWGWRRSRLATLWKEVGKR